MKDYLKTPYVLLSGLLLLCFLASFILPAQFEWIKNFSLEMASEIIGILLVVFSIDRVIALEQKKEKKKLEKVTCLQLRRPLLRHFYLIFNLFKASIAEKPNKEYERVTDLFDEYFFQEIAFLDFSQTAPVFTIADTSWSEYLTRECEQFQEALNNTTEKYALFLPPDILDLIEEIINDPFIWLVLQAQNIRQLGNGNKDNSNSSPYNFLARKEIRELLRDYTQKFSKLLIYYNENVPKEKRIELTNELWNNDVPPKIGSSRVARKSVEENSTPETMEISNA